jgi:RND family efflux transporter MFP subunit
MNVNAGLLGSGRNRIVAALLALLVVTGGVVASRANTPAAKPDYRTAPVTRGAVTQTVAVSGSVNAAGTLKLNFRTAGTLAEVLVGVGSQVTAGQVLARIDTTDLATAVRQQQANVASAQAKYDATIAGVAAEDIAVARQSVDNARKSFDETAKTTANDVLAAKQSLDNTIKQGKNDIAAAQQSLTKLQSAYTTAKSNVASLVSAIRSDVGTFATTIDAAKIAVGSTISDISTNTGADAKSATASLYSAQGSLSLALTYAQAVTPALLDYATAYNALLTDIASFDSAAASGGDTSSANVAYQRDASAYATAAAKLSTTLDAPTAQLNSAQTSVNAAQTSLNTSQARLDGGLDQGRTDVLNLQSLLTGDVQLSANLKAKITQAGTSVATITDAVGGSYVAAQQAYQTAKDKDAINQLNAKQSYDATVEKSNSTLLGAQNSIDSAVTSYNKTAAAPKQTDIASAYASLLSAQAALDTANNNVTNATLRAPSAGVIATVASQVGENVTSGGSTGFITLANVSSLALHGTVGEADVARLKLGQVATITVDAVGTARMTGKVTSLDPVATIQQGVPVYGIDVTIDVPNPQVRPGMSATAAVILASKQGVLTVPNLAIRSQAGRRYVQVLRDGQTVDLTDIQFGLANDTVTEVTSGIEEADVVVLPQPRAAGSARPQTGGGFPGGGGAQQPVIIGR